MAVVGPRARAGHTVSRGAHGGAQWSRCALRRSFATLPRSRGVVALTQRSPRPSAEPAPRASCAQAARRSRPPAEGRATSRRCEVRRQPARRAPLRDLPPKPDAPSRARPRHRHCAGEGHADRAARRRRIWRQRRRQHVVRCAAFGAIAGQTPLTAHTPSATLCACLPLAPPRLWLLRSQRLVPSAALSGALAPLQVAQERRGQRHGGLPLPVDCDGGRRARRVVRVQGDVVGEG